MNKKLRLLVTAKCHNKCPMCCNNQFDFEKIPVVDRLDYDEISITGGEPLLPGSSHLTTWLVGGIKATQYAMGLPESKFTSILHSSILTFSEIAVTSSTESASRLTRRWMLKSLSTSTQRCLSRREMESSTTVSTLTAPSVSTSSQT